MRVSVSRPRSRTATVVLALGLAVVLAVAGLRLVSDQQDRRRDVDKRLTEQGTFGAAMLSTLARSTGSSLGDKLTPALARGPVGGAELDRLARRSGARYLELLAPDGTRLARSRHAPASVGVSQDLRDADGVPTVAVLARVGRRTVVVGFPRTNLGELLKTLSGVPRPWPVDLFLLDGRGRTIDAWSPTAAAPAPLRLTGGRLQEAARAPLRTGPVAISVAPVTGTSWMFAIRADRADTDAAVAGDVVLLPWALLAIAVLAALCVLVMIGRGRRDAEALAEERERAVAVLSVLDDGYLYLRDGHVVEVNARLCALTGHAREELVGAGAEHPLVAALIAGESVLPRADGTQLDAAVRTSDLPGRHRGRVSIVRDIGPQVREERRLAHLASTDALTGLANRGAFDAALARHIEASERDRVPLSLVVFDIDAFKAVNDQHGHPVGDRVLVEVARRLADAVRDSDLVARIGGEEFACLLPGLGAEAAQQLADRVRRSVGARPFPVVGALTLSAGACARGGHDAAELYACADRALLQAKRAGRDRTVALAA